MMLAMVFQGAGLLPKQQMMPRPKLLQPTDVIVRVHKTTICGTDLHILAGNVPQTQPGRILGHEGIGVITEVGVNVRKHKVGDRILVNCITACGLCESCKEHKHGHCTDGGWQFGTLIDGMQAEYARVPHADYTAHSLPDSVPLGSPLEDRYMMASDVLPTSWEIGLRNGRFRKDASATVAVVGAGPLGLSVVLCAASEMAPGSKVIAIDLNQQRLDAAREMGATDCLNNTAGDAVERVMELTNGKGVDFVVECIGTPTGFHICQDIIAVGGEISILGVHGKPARLDLQKIWDRNVSIHSGVVHGESIPYFIDKIKSGSLASEKLISHGFSMRAMDDAYAFFKDAGNTGSLKVVIKNDLVRPRPRL